MTRSIAYYESWASHRVCNKYMPSDIDPTPYTHINFAFALIDKDGKVMLSLSNDTILFDQLKDVRDKSLDGDVELWISVGGYAVGSGPFAKLAATQQGRKTFIDSACAFMDKYGFKGMDLDWEYPAATDTGGTTADTKNMVSLVKEYREKCKNKGLSVTLPGGTFYMKGFDLKGLEPYVDWLNFMAYDLHGSWEKPTIAEPHTNLSDIQQSLQLVWNAGVSPEKVILGLADYGKTYTLSGGSCTNPGCAATGPGLAGPCSNEAGSLHNAEIDAILKKHTDIKPQLDKKAAVKYFSWDKTQWVSYDDKETWQLKKQYAAEKCLAGTLEWAVDMNVISSKDTKDDL
ncbi:chitinase [Talaromyces pinophilus]|uniref:chitinase n=1 Tax=Talaromyces pinophilus TaxID=128442 RepID=A0A6V8HQC3_TALPI|nr:chitinase [Talaromyces pinophilus]